MIPVVIGDCTLCLGDSAEVLPTIGRVDALVTDPPYGVNLGKHRGSKDTRVTRVLVKGGYGNYDDTPENFAAVVVPIIKQALSIADRGLVFCAMPAGWILPKPDAMGGVYMPSGCGRNKWGFACLAHYLLYGTAPALHLGAYPTSFQSTDRAEKNGHPCPKPLSWMLKAVGLASREGQIVLDPFMGSGTTGVACVKTGRRFIGIENDPTYFAIACDRIRKAYADAPLLQGVA